MTSCNSIANIFSISNKHKIFTCKKFKVGRHRELCGLAYGFNPVASGQNPGQIICSLYKKKQLKILQLWTGFHFNTSEFVRQSYDKEEVFYNNRNFNISQHVDSSKIIVEEIRSITAGRCYMVCAAKKLKKGEWFNIYFKRTLDIKGVLLNQS